MVFYITSADKFLGIVAAFKLAEYIFIGPLQDVGLNILTGRGAPYRE
jgi:hypothetical protein